ncbi:hypothetical protein IEE94_05435 [Yimella sp. cx-573]|nr:hypothetical protein [Yimella sp. cx-573]
MPTAHQLPVADRDVLLLSPHLDDAWLSAAALIQSGECEIWTVFAGRPAPAQQTAWDIASGFADSDATMAARLAEDQAAFHGLEHRVRRLPYLDAAYAEPPLRREQAAAVREDLTVWAVEHPHGVIAVPVGAGVHVEQAAWERARERLRQPVAPSEAAAAPATQDPATQDPATQDPGETAPAAADHRHLAGTFVRKAMHADHQRRRRKAQRRGMAANPDHLLVRDAAIAVAGTTSTVDVLAWEDLPYLWHARGAARVPGLERAHGLSAERFEVEVDVAEKFVRLANYASQLEVLDPQRGRLADPAGLPSTETYWMLRRNS